MIAIADTDGRTAAEVMSSRVSTLPASATVGELRDYFGESGSRRLAVLVDGDRYAGSIPVADLPEEAEPSEAAAAYAKLEPTIGPEQPAGVARDRALADPMRRLPVVDDAGTLLGIVAIDEKLIRFCGT